MFMTFVDFIFITASFLLHVQPKIESIAINKDMSHNKKFKSGGKCNPGQTYNGTKDCINRALNLICI